MWRIAQRSSLYSLHLLKDVYSRFLISFWAWRDFSTSPCDICLHQWQVRDCITVQISLPYQWLSLQSFGLIQITSLLPCYKNPVWQQTKQKVSQKNRELLGSQKASSGSCFLRKIWAKTWNKNLKKKKKNYPKSSTDPTYGTLFRRN